jgi:hypothetical protein
MLSWSWSHPFQLNIEHEHNRPAFIAGVQAQILAIALDLPAICFNENKPTFLHVLGLILERSSFDSPAQDKRSDFLMP